MIRPASQQPQSPPTEPPPRLRSERHRAPLLWLLLPFMAGLAIAKISPVSLPVGWLLASALSLTITAFILAPRHSAGLIPLVFAMLLAGAASYEITRTRLGVYDTLPPREARLTLRITYTFPPPAKTAANASFNARPRISGLARITDAAPHLRELIGQPLYFSLTPPPSADFASNNLPRSTTAPSELIRTAEITAIGMLQPLPRNAETDTFDGYLAASGMNFRFTRGRILSLSKPPTATAAFYERARLRFSEFLSRGLDHRPQQAGVLRAMVLGQKQDIDENQNALFLGSGTMHLFAISGLHIAVIATGLQFLLLVFRLPRWARLVIGTAALWIYVQITGASPSAMRAFAMISLLQTAFVLRLPVNALATLVFAALATLVAAPMQLFSASFQMSYGIVAALLLYGLPLGESWLARWTLFRDIPEVTWTHPQRAISVAQRYFLGVLGIGIAASLVSAICGTIYFKLFTPGALLANLLLIPAASFVILSGFLSIVFGLIGAAPLSILFNHAAALLLFLMEKALAYFVTIPGVSAPAQFAPAWTGYATLAVLLATMLFGYAHKWRLSRGGFWLPVAVVVIALFFLVRFG